jgi:hypothetical protein
MAYNIELPDGSIVEGIPDNVPLAEAKKNIAIRFPQFAPKPDESKSGFFPALQAGFKGLKGDIAGLAGRTGIMDVGAAEKYIAEQQKQSEKIFQPTQDDWTESPWKKLKELAGGSAAYMAAPAIAGLGALALPEAVAGAGAAALTGLVSGAQFAGSNLTRQVEEGTPLAQTDLAAAALAAIPQAALDVVSLKMIPGVRGIFGAAGKKMTVEEAEAIATQGLKRTVADYALTTGKTMGAEGLTEAGQQVFERLQAGLSLTDEKAQKEYLDNFLGGAILGGAMAPVGRYFERGREQREAEIVGAMPGQRPGESLAEAAQRLKNEIDAEKLNLNPPAPPPPDPNATPLMDKEALGLVLDSENGYGKLENYKRALMALPQTDEIRNSLAEVQELQAAANVNLVYGQVADRLSRQAVPEGNAALSLLPADLSTVITPELANMMGLVQNKFKNNVFNQIVGKDMAVPEDVNTVRSVLENHISKIRPGDTSSKIATFLRSIPPATETANVGTINAAPSGEGAIVASEPGAGAPAAGVGTTEPSGVVPTGENVTGTVGGEGTKPSSIEEMSLVSPSTTAAERQPSMLKEREAFGKATGAVREAGGWKLRGRVNQPAAKAVMLEDTPGVLSALSKSKNVFTQKISELASLIPGLKTRINPEASEEEDQYRQTADENTIVAHTMHINQLDAMRELKPIVEQLPNDMDHVPYKLLSQYVLLPKDTIIDDLGNGNREITLREFQREKTIVKKSFLNTLEKLEAETKELGENRMRQSIGRVPYKRTAVAGSFDRSTNTVEIQSPYYAKDEHILTHEYTHAITSYAIDNPTAEQKPIVRKLQKLFEHVKGNLEKVREEVHPLHDKQYANTHKPYGLTNIHEFVSEAWSNPDFQYWLSKIAYEKTTAWSKFVETIAQLLGIKDSNALTEAIALSEELVTAAKTGTEAQEKEYFSKRKPKEATKETKPPVELSEVEKQDLAAIEAFKAEGPARIAEKTEQIKNIMGKILNRMGLKDVAIKIMDDIESKEAGGSYSEKLIKIALDEARPVSTLRHEAIHALKELGFFSENQWNTLVKQAKEGWIDTYLKNRDVNGGPLKEGEKSRYDIYMERPEFKSDPNAIIEEAIADAFGDFDTNGAPPGMLKAILNRLISLFDAIKSALQGNGIYTSEQAARQVFGKIARGELKAGETKAGGEKLSLAVSGYLYHRSNLDKLSSVKNGDKFVLQPGPQGAEGKGVYFSQDKTVRETTAEGTARKPQTAVVVIKTPSRDGWYVSKTGKTIKYGKPRTWHTENKTINLQAVDVKTIEGEKVIFAEPISNWVNPQEKLSLRAPNTEAFKQWFGDSKVVDENGEPLVVYHGTAQSLIGGAFSSEQAKSEGLAFYFSHSPLMKNPAENANDYAKNRLGEEQQVMPVYLSIENPLVVGFTEPMPTGDAAIEKWLDRMGKFNRSIDMSKEQYFQKAIREAKKSGHDGVIVRNIEDVANDVGKMFTEETDVYIAFKPNQIKSATGNIGTYNRENPDIRYSLRTIPDTKEFKQWSRDAPVIRYEETEKYKGGPAVFQAFHGTTHTGIETFDVYKGNADGALGAGSYLTTSPEDASANYAGVGPDLTARIAREEESLSDSFNDDDYNASEMLNDYFQDNKIDNEVTDNNFDELKDEYGEQAIHHAAQKALKGDSEGLVMPAYVRMLKPFDMRPKGLFLDYSYKTDEEGDPIDGSEQGALIDFLEAARNVLEAYGPNEFTSTVLDEAADGISAKEIFDIATKTLSDNYDDNGVVSSGHIVQEIAREAGYDGLIQDANSYFGTGRKGFGGLRVPSMVGVQEGVLHLMPFKDNQIKSAIGNQGTYSEKGNIKFSLRDKLGLYSELENKIEAVGPNQAPAPQWKAMIKGMVQKGVKPEEIEWSGVNDYLDLQEGKVSKASLLEYLKEGGVKVEETTLGDSQFTQKMSERLDELEENNDRTDEEDLERQQLIRLENLTSNITTRYGSYQLPNGNNYREVLLTLPEQKPSVNNSGWTAKLLRLKSPITAMPEFEIYDANGNIVSVIRTAKDSKQAIDLAASQLYTKQKRSANYKSNHWNQPNVIAHVRLNDRVDENGNKVLFVEEVQSDWGQEGKKEGFKSDNDLPRKAAKAIRKDDYWEVRDQNNAFITNVLDYDIPNFGGENEAINEGQRRLEESESQTAPDKRVPNAPFVNKTESWLNLALKRIMVIAAEGGYDKVAFITGQQSHKRFPKKNDGSSTRGSFSAFYGEADGSVVDDNGEQKFDKNGKPVVPMVQTVLKELLRKIDSTTLNTIKIKAENKPWRYIYGLINSESFDTEKEAQDALHEKAIFDLKEYAEIKNPSESEINKMIAHYDGAVFRVPTLNQPGFDVTPEMKQKVETTGLPKFSLRSTWSPSINAAIDRTSVARIEEGWASRILNAISPKHFSEYRQVWLNRYNQLGVYDKMRADRMGGFGLLADASAEAAAMMSDYGAGLTAAVFSKAGGVPVYANGMTTVSTLNGTIKGPLEIFSELTKLGKGDSDIYRAYQLWAGVKRGKRLMPSATNPNGTEVNYTPADIAEAKKLCALDPGDPPGLYPEFANVQKEWIKYNNQLAKYLVDTGVISSAARAEWIKYADYIPFYRQMDDEPTLGPKLFQSLTGVKPPKKLKGGSDLEVGDFLENIIRNTQSAIQMGIKNTAGQKAVTVALGLNSPGQTDVLEPLGYVSTTPDCITILVNGQKKSFRSQDRLWLQAVTSLNLPDVPFMGIFAKPAQLLRTLVTKDPGFMLANMIRDSMSALVTSGTSSVNPATTISNFAAAIAGKSPEFQALFNAGILGGHEYSKDIIQSGNKFASDLRKTSGYKTANEKLASPVVGLWEALEKGTTASDAATRMQVYKEVLAQTGNEAEAIYRAVEVMNFNRKGNSAIVRVLTAAIPFLNARVQGLDVFYRAAFGKNTNKQTAAAIQKQFFIRGATMMAMSCMYWALTHDDDDYKKQEQETKDNYWLLPSLGIKLPIPFEVGVLFKVIPERIMARTFGKDTNKDFTDSMVRQLMSTLAFNPIPQAFKPLIEYRTNYNFFTDRPIVGQGLEGAESGYQVGPNTSAIAADIGKATGMSPLKLDQLIGGYTGTMGMYAFSLLDSIYKINGDSPDASKRFEQSPVIKRFLIDPDARGTVSAYYETKNAADAAVRTASLLERSMNFKEWGPYYKDNIKLLSTHDYLLDLEKSMKDFREMKLMIRASKIDGDQKRDALLKITKAENQLTANIQTIKKNIGQ